MNHQLSVQISTGAGVCDPPKAHAGTCIAGMISLSDSCRSEEAVSPHSRRYRPATSDHLLASATTVRKEDAVALAVRVESFKKRQRIPVLVPRNYTPSTPQQQGQTVKHLESFSAGGEAATR